MIFFHFKSLTIGSKNHKNNGTVLRLGPQGQFYTTFHKNLLTGKHLQFFCWNHLFWLPGHRFWEITYKFLKLLHKLAQNMITGAKDYFTCLVLGKRNSGLHFHSTLLHWNLKCTIFGVPKQKFTKSIKVDCRSW